ncbi:MAG TPA: glycosyltransferase family 4 protein [Steroidobacteraceae bacterium]|nr:glycosyltransferase family 4 protein [Steroidobacteraceae bacterium]
MLERSIDIAAAGKFHAHHLAAELASLGRLRDFYNVRRSLAPPPRVPPRRFHNRLDLALWSAAARLGPVGYRHDRAYEIFDEWLRRRLETQAPGVLHSWNGNSRATFRALKGRGWRLCLERSCPHNRVQYELLREESAALGVPFAPDPQVLERAIEELYLADIIVAPSRYSARSYADPELARKVRVNPLGGNVRYRERPRATPRSSSRRGVKVLMVGNNFLRKGTHYLIEAFRHIRDGGAELWIRGDVPEAYRGRIADPRVRILPAVSLARLHELYARADVFVQPSIDEGFGMTVFEALGFGLPVVVTENVGALDLLSPQVALTVPIRDPPALADAIEAARMLPGDAFDAARRTLLERNSWAACTRRMLQSVYADSVSPARLSAEAT